MDRQMIRCVVTRYRVEDRTLISTTEEEMASFHVRGDWLYLHNSAASARVDDLLRGACEGRSWCAQAGTPPVYIDGKGWGGRNWPEINVSSEALLEALEGVLAEGEIK